MDGWFLHPGGAGSLVAANDNARPWSLPGALLLGLGLSLLVWATILHLLQLLAG
jgi:hypothetical protein